MNNLDTGNQTPEFNRIAEVPANCLIQVTREGKLRPIIEDGKALLDTVQRSMESEGIRVLRYPVSQVEMNDDGSISYTLDTNINGMSKRIVQNILR